MAIHITCLSENTAARDDVLAEWGQSLFIEADGGAVLFDAGRGVSATANAATLGVDLSRVSKIVLSHGHHDHTGGLRDILRQIGHEVEVVAHPDIWLPRYRRRTDGQIRHIGIPFARAELEGLGARFTLTTQPVNLTGGVMTTGEVPMTTEFEKNEPQLVVRDGADYVTDQFRDDLALVITTPAGLVVALGCAHHGIINTLNHARKLTGIRQVHAVLGGAHLVSSSAERVWLTIAALKELGVTRLGLCHCTGLPAIATLAGEFGTGFFYCNSGTTITLPEEG